MCIEDFMINDQINTSNQPEDRDTPKWPTRLASPINPDMVGCKSGQTNKTSTLYVNV